MTDQHAASDSPLDSRNSPGSPSEATRSATSHLYWCRACGRVQWSDAAPICRHFVIDGPPVRRMEPIPSYHPLAKGAA